MLHQLLNKFITTARKINYLRCLSRHSKSAG